MVELPLRHPQLFRAIGVKVRECSNQNVICEVIYEMFYILNCRFEMSNLKCHLYFSLTVLLNATLISSFDAKF